MCPSLTWGNCFRSQSQCSRRQHNPLKREKFPCKRETYCCILPCLCRQLLSMMQNLWVWLECVEALLLQIAALNICSLQDRACTEDLIGNKAIKSQDHEFLHTFYTATQGLVAMSTDLGAMGGFLPDFLPMLKSYMKRLLEDGTWTRGSLLQNPGLWRARVHHRKQETTWQHCHLVTLFWRFHERYKIKGRKSLLIPLRKLCSRISGIGMLTNLSTSSKAARRSLVDLRSVERKKMQWWMPDVITHSASLTNYVGKTFDHETIVVGSKSKQNQAHLARLYNSRDSNRNLERMVSIMASCKLKSLATRKLKLS